ncbi:hypothetical protein KM043_016718 [Ampulex compressa]|nr:hypothetical protein KM043_016718 [Ampulex compressa]
MLSSSHRFTLNAHTKARDDIDDQAAATWQQHNAANTATDKIGIQTAMSRTPAGTHAFFARSLRGLARRSRIPLIIIPPSRTPGRRPRDTIRCRVTSYRTSAGPSPFSRPSLSRLRNPFLVWSKECRRYRIKLVGRGIWGELMRVAERGSNRFA